MPAILRGPFMDKYHIDSVRSFLQDSFNTGDFRGEILLNTNLLKIQAVFQY